MGLAFADLGHTMIGPWRLLDRFEAVGQDDDVRAEHLPTDERHDRRDMLIMSVSG